MRRESTLPKLVSKGSISGKRIRRISTPSTLIAVSVFVCGSKILACMAREKIAHRPASCNKCCTRIDTMQRTMLYSGPQATRIYTDQNQGFQQLFFLRSGIMKGYRGGSLLLVLCLLLAAANAAAETTLSTS